MGRPETGNITGKSLAEALAWIRDSGENNTAYTIVLGADEPSPPVTLEAGNTASPVYNKTNVAIVLKGASAERNISLSGTGSLFTIGGGQNLSLDQYITLRGVNNNTMPLVVVREFGGLLMRGDSKITGNSNVGGAGGGVYSDGTFTMEDSASVYNNTAGGGDGGGVATSGIFTMQGNASVHDNTTGDHGGGVSTTGTFTMQDSASVYNNTADGGGGVSPGGTFIMRGNSSV
ncbi:MAG: hypothetical protein LBI90_03090 [Treponema sp.]|jgi:predicted outer membrane repeat protein|nr:hypothetical protein [Treponema sp.]